MTSGLKTIALGLTLANLAAVPQTVASLGSSDDRPSYWSGSSCGCDLTPGSSTARRPSDEGEASTLSFPPPPSPKDLDVECPSGCTTQVWTWWFCLKEPDQSCDRWEHDYTVYYCPGTTYYNCDGYTWTDTNISCSGCSQTSLPSGCHPLGPHTFTACDRYRLGGV